MDDQITNAQKIALLSNQIQNVMNNISQCFNFKVEVTVLIRNLDLPDADLLFSRDDLNKVLLAIDELRKQKDH